MTSTNGMSRLNAWFWGGVSPRFLDDPEPPEPGFSRVVVDAINSFGRAINIVFRIRLDTVDVVADNHVAAVMDRDGLRQWLREPEGDLFADEIRLTWDRMIDHRGRVAISVPGVRCWPLSPDEMALLRERV